MGLKKTVRLILYIKYLPLTNMKNIEELEKANIGRLMLKYFIPAFIGVFVNALYNIVDRIFIGQGVGAEALSGISVIFPVMLIMMGFGMLIGIGTGVLVSINLGKKNIEMAEKTIGTGFSLMFLVSVGVMVNYVPVKRTHFTFIWFHPRNISVCQRLPQYYFGRNSFYGDWVFAQ
jgi:Na+-driven multidrug efflux pump